MSAAPSTSETPRPRRGGLLAFLWTFLPLATLAGTALAFGLAAWRTEPAAGRRPSAPDFPDLPEVREPAREARVEGRVLDARGAAVADALVHLRASEEPAWSTTDAEGRFALEGLEDGPWNVTVVARWYAPLVTTLAQEGRLTICELGLGEPLEAPPALEPFARGPLVGRVLAAAPLELEGLELWLEPEEPLERLDAPLPARATLDARGHFRFEELVLGRYRARLLPSWARGGSWPDLCRSLDRAGEGPLVEHRRGRGELELHARNARIAGLVLDRRGGPLAGALVTIAPADDPARPWPARATDAEGRFSIDDLAAGSYRLRVRAGAAVEEHVLELVPGRTVALELRPRQP